MNKLALRRAWFQVHQWIGLTLAILIIPLCLSGSALVRDEALDHWLNPARYAVTGQTLLTPDAYVAAARTVLKPGDRVSMLTLPGRDGPVIVSASPAAKGPPRGGPPARTSVYLDPPTARVLDVTSGSGGVLRFLHILHGSLQIPGWGRTVVGWIGVAMMLSCFTGLWLWWPTVGRLGRAFRWGRHRNLDTNLHQTFGFWIALPLFVLSLTGAWIAFPAFFGALSGQASGGGPDRAALVRARPLADPAHPLRVVIAKATAVTAGRLVSVAWPTDRSPDWTVTISRGGAAPASVKVADDTGTAIAAPARVQDDAMRLVRRIHDGTGMGAVWQTIIFVGGLIPAMLAVTGVVMWWRGRRWRAQVATKRRSLRGTTVAE